MGKQDLYLNHVDPEYRRWRRKYHSFPGVEECVRLILEGKNKGAWADIIPYELANHARDHLQDLIHAFRTHQSDAVALNVLMAIEMAALPESVDFLSEILRSGNTSFMQYARRALQAIDTKASRTVLYETMDTPQSE